MMQCNELAQRILIVIIIPTLHPGFVTRQRSMRRVELIIASSTGPIPLRSADGPTEIVQDHYSLPFRVIGHESADSAHGKVKVQRSSTYFGGNLIYVSITLW